MKEIKYVDLTLFENGGVKSCIFKGARAVAQSNAPLAVAHKATIFRAFVEGCDYDDECWKKLDQKEFDNWLFRLFVAVEFGEKRYIDNMVRRFMLWLSYSINAK